MPDLTLVYYTASVVPEPFLTNTWVQLVAASEERPIIVVSQKPFLVQHTEWRNIVVDLPRSHLSIYKQALIGAKEAATEYIALCEDDVLYSQDHFKHRPKCPGKFAYNMNAWNLYTWSPIFSQKLGGRKNLNGLICERELFIEAMEERFAKYPDGNVDLGIWAEPGKYERQLGVTVREAESFVTNPPNVIFSHEKELSFGNLGKRKRLGEIRATEIPTWGRAEDVLKLY